MTEKPIRILHVLGLFDYGGAESLVMNVFRHMDHSKLMFDFVVHSEEVGAFEEEAKRLGAAIYRVPQYKGKNHVAYRKAWKSLFKEHPEYAIIHGHVRSTASIYLKIAKDYGLKTIAHSHSISSGTGISAKVKDFMQKGIRKRADEFLACSQIAGEWLFGSKVIKQSNFHIMNNAIDADKFLYDAERRKNSRKELNITDETVIGHIGRLHEAKNHLRLLNIFNEYQKLQPNSLLLLVGDGDLRETIEDKVTQLGLNEKVRLLGSRKDTYDLVQAMDLFLFPSVYEGLGISVVESQASGLPTLVSTAVPNEAIFTDRVVSLSLDESDQTWAATLNQLPKTDRESLVTLENIKEAKFEIEEISQWYADFISELLQG